MKDKKFEMKKIDYGKLLRTYKQGFDSTLEPMEILKTLLFKFKQLKFFVWRNAVR
jgi:hypothetical protein